MEVDDTKFNEEVKHAVNNGNINVTTNDDDEDNHDVFFNREVLEATKKQEKLIANINEKRIKQNLKIPTNDNDVKIRLRTLGEPICYFGEDASDRRDRLKNILTKMKNEGKTIPEFRKNHKQLLSELQEISMKINNNRPYFSKGHPWLKKVRLNILKYSMNKAKNRIKLQQYNREHPIPLYQRKEEEKELNEYLQGITCQSSELIRNERPLTCIKISDKIYDLNNIDIKNEDNNDNNMDMDSDIKNNNDDDMQSIKELISKIYTKLLEVLCDKATLVLKLNQSLIDHNEQMEEERKKKAKKLFNRRLSKDNNGNHSRNT